MFIKNNVTSFLSNLYAKKLEEFVNGSKTEIIVKELIGFNSSKDEKDYTLQDYVDRFYDYYVSEYYRASTYGVGKNLSELKLYKTKQASIDEKENILEFKATDGTYKKVYDLGYDFLKSSNKTYGSITEQQFYYGALEAFKGYEQFKKMTMDYGRSFFGNKVPDYDIQTYEYAKRALVSVGAEDPENKRFSFNCDPYYSLPKWSVTSFANHESVMGHHNQFMSADNFLAKVDGVNLGPRTFNYTSYIEGWALFMEWFGIEAGYYGTPDYTSDDYYAMPKDFSFAKGITSFATADNVSKPEVIEQIKNLHGGVYWNKVAEVNKYTGKDEDHAKAAIKLANMLQYIGALNEAQLRNMRLAVDTAYHGGTVAGNSDLPAGASIKQARDYMTKNSALGIGDITSESKRYFNLAGQATSYNSGKEVFMDLYRKIHNKLGLTREQFINQVTPEFKEHGQIKKFFDLILRNSALPMGAIEEIMKRVYGI